MMNTVIQKISARQVLDCKARPMLEVDVFTQDGSMGRGAAPTGTSVGAHEAFVLRDYDVNEFNGLSVHKAVNTVETVIAPALLGMDAADQRAIDQRMLELDGTENKERLGGNSIYSVLLAEVVWIVFDRAYAVFRIKWSQWMHRAGADGSSRL